MDINKVKGQDSEESKISLEAIFKEYKHFLLLPIFGILYIWFYYLEKTVVAQYIMFSPMDMRIPFLKEFVVPYLYWYIYMAFGFIYLGIVSKKEYYRLFWFMFLGMTICYGVYTLFPNGQNLRPPIIENDIFSNMIKLIYEADTPTNVAPSIHVFNSIAIHIGLIKYEPFRKNLIMRSISFISMVMISASTVFIKQHSVLDGLWAILLSVIIYLVVYILPDLVLNREKMKNNDQQICSLNKQ